MARRVRNSRAARANLIATFNYIRQEAGSRTPADRYVEEVLAKCEHLAGLPATMGRSRDDLANGLRSFVIRRHIIFFHYANPGILDVVAILEGHRDLDAYFGHRQ